MVYRHIASCAALRDARCAICISSCIAGLFVLFVCVQIDHPAATGLPLHSWRMIRSLQVHIFGAVVPASTRGV